MNERKGDFWSSFEEIQKRSRTLNELREDKALSFLNSFSQQRNVVLDQSSGLTQAFGSHTSDEGKWSQNKLMGNPQLNEDVRLFTFINQQQNTSTGQNYRIGEASQNIGFQMDDISDRMNMMSKRHATPENAIPVRTVVMDHMPITRNVTIRDGSDPGQSASSSFFNVTRGPTLNEGRVVSETYSNALSLNRNVVQNSLGSASAIQQINTSEHQSQLADELKNVIASNPELRRLFVEMYKAGDNSANPEISSSQQTINVESNAVDTTKTKLERKELLYERRESDSSRNKQTKHQSASRSKSRSVERNRRSKSRSPRFKRDYRRRSRSRSRSRDRRRFDNRSRERRRSRESSEGRRSRRDTEDRNLSDEKRKELKRKLDVKVDSDQPAAKVSDTVTQNWEKTQAATVLSPQEVNFGFNVRQPLALAHFGMQPRMVSHSEDVRRPWTPMPPQPRPFQPGSEWNAPPWARTNYPGRIIVGPGFGARMPNVPIIERWVPEPEPIPPARVLVDDGFWHVDHKLANQRPPSKVLVNVPLMPNSVTGRIIPINKPAVGLPKLMEMSLTKTKAIPVALKVGSSVDNNRTKESNNSAAELRKQAVVTTNSVLVKKTSSCNSAIKLNLLTKRNSRSPDRSKLRLDSNIQGRRKLTRQKKRLRKMFSFDCCMYCGIKHVGYHRALGAISLPSEATNRTPKVSQPKIHNTAKQNDSRRSVEVMSPEPVKDNLSQNVEVVNISDDELQDENTGLNKNKTTNSENDTTKAVTKEEFPRSKGNTDSLGSAIEKDDANKKCDEGIASHVDAADSNATVEEESSRLDLSGKCAVVDEDAVVNKTSRLEAISSDDDDVSGLEFQPGSDSEFVVLEELTDSDGVVVEEGSSDEEIPDELASSSAQADTVPIVEEPETPVKNDEQERDTSETIIVDESEATEPESELNKSNMVELESKQKSQIITSRLEVESDQNSTSEVIIVEEPEDGGEVDMKKGKDKTDEQEDAHETVKNSVTSEETQPHADHEEENEEDKMDMEIDENVMDEDGVVIDELGESDDDNVERGTPEDTNVVDESVDVAEESNDVVLLDNDDENSDTGVEDVYISDEAMEEFEELNGRIVDLVEELEDVIDQRNRNKLTNVSDSSEVKVVSGNGKDEELEVVSRNDKDEVKVVSENDKHEEKKVESSDACEMDEMKKIEENGGTREMGELKKVEETSDSSGMAEVKDMGVGDDNDDMEEVVDDNEASDSDEVTEIARNGGSLDDDDVKEVHNEKIAASFQDVGSKNKVNADDSAQHLVSDEEVNQNLAEEKDLLNANPKSCELKESENDGDSSDVVEYLPQEVDTASKGSSIFCLDDSSIVSDQAVDHFVAGSYKTAFQLLNDQIGVVNFMPFKLVSIPGKCTTALMTLPEMPTFTVNCSKMPKVGLTMEETVTRLQVCYQATTSGSPDKAIDLFRSVLQSVPLMKVDKRRGLVKAKMLINICRNYITSLVIETKKKSLDRTVLENEKRACELAAYETHCNLQSVHQVLTLRIAQSMFYKIGNYKSAASFARQILKAKPPAEVVEKTNKMLAVCEKNMTDAVQLSYDPERPFSICIESLTPIYGDEPDLKCPFCSACYVPSYNGILCRICCLAEVGRQASGMKLVIEERT